MVESSSRLSFLWNAPFKIESEIVSYICTLRVDDINSRCFVLKLQTFYKWKSEEDLNAVPSSSGHKRLFTACWMLFDTRFFCRSLNKHPYAQCTLPFFCLQKTYFYTECIVETYKIEQIKWLLVTAVANETKANKHEIDTRKCKHGGRCALWYRSCWIM